MSGRISDIVIHPKRRATWYVAVGSGGVWKTENAGTTWTPVFDAQGAYSIGCITLDPANPETVWVGTGENVSGRHVGYGDGVYKSLNGGKTWTNVGLKSSEHIARILVDPRDSRVVYVAAEGPLWSAGGERGLYKSADGGKTWAISLEISKDTGVTSAEMDPSNPDILYAAAYQRRRTVAAFMGGGPESAIYKSEDAGKSWRKLEVGLPKGDVGKIGLAVSPIDPRVVYATVEAAPDERGFYRSANKGESFEKRSSFISGGTGPHYYQEIFADPNTFDRVYQMNPGLMVTHDGGKTFVRVPEKNKHGDNHAMAFVPGDADYILNGSDGGRVRNARPRRDVAVLREPAGDAVLQAGPRQCAAVLQRARRRAGQRQPDGAVADAQLARHLELRLDDHLRRRRIRDCRRSDRPGHRLSRVAGGQPAPVRPEEPRDDLHQPEARPW